MICLRDADLVARGDEEGRSRCSGRARRRALCCCRPPDPSAVCPSHDDAGPSSFDQPDPLERLECAPDGRSDDPARRASRLYAARTVGLPCGRQEQRSTSMRADWCGVISRVLQRIRARAASAPASAGVRQSVVIGGFSAPNAPRRYHPSDKAILFPLKRVEKRVELSGLEMHSPPSCAYQIGLGAPSGALRR